MLFPGRRLSAAALLVCLVSITAQAQVAAPRRGDIDAAQLMRDVEVLAGDDMQGRLAGTPSGAKARGYILERFKQIGLPPFGESHEYRFAFQPRGTTEQRTGVNLLGFIRGTGPTDRYIVVTAHYDHIGVRDGQVYNGADDNATGVAALLAVAAHFLKNPPATSLVIAAVDAEEGGLRGSRALLGSAPRLRQGSGEATLKKESIVMNVNIDMIGRDAKNVLYAVGTYHYPSLRPLLEGVAQAPVELRFGHDVPGTKDEDWTNSSDHAAFHQAGIPFIYFGVEDFENHHKPSDDAATIQRALLAGATKTIVAAVERLTRELK